MYNDISIHAPLRERPSGKGNNQFQILHFNPRSLTGATHFVLSIFFSIIISIHAPLRERLFGDPPPLNASGISIHAPLRERLGLLNGQNQVAAFQSTLPYGSDAIPPILYRLHNHFNPRSLTGATGASRPYCFKNEVFQSTLPYGSDFTGAALTSSLEISIHAPLRERLKP